MNVYEAKAAGWEPEYEAAIELLVNAEMLVEVDGPVYRIDKRDLALHIVEWTYEPEGQTALELLDEVLVEVGKDNE